MYHLYIIFESVRTIIINEYNSANSSRARFSDKNSKRAVFQLVCLVFQLTQKNDQNQLFFELNRTI